MTLPAQAQAALDSFASCTSWEQRARLLMQWGQRLSELDERDKIEANRVHGCESQVWLVGECKDGHWQFAASSDARLIRGLVALLLFWLAAAFMLFGVWLHLTERHEHMHQHQPLQHTHRHTHDEHHQHEHAEDVTPGAAHSHGHVHSPVRHSHPHFPDIHHRHRH